MKKYNWKCFIKDVFVELFIQLVMLPNTLLKLVGFSFAKRFENRIKNKIRIPYRCMIMDGNWYVEE